MLSDKQSLTLCGVLAGGLFITGVLNILDHVLTFALLALVFIVIIANLIIAHSTPKKK